MRRLICCSGLEIDAVSSRQLGQNCIWNSFPAICVSLRLILSIQPKYMYCIKFLGHFFFFFLNFKRCILKSAVSTINSCYRCFNYQTFSMCCEPIFDCFLLILKLLILKLIMLIGLDIVHNMYLSFCSNLKNANTIIFCRLEEKETKV